MLIYVGMILLDNLMQCLLFIAMIDLSKTCRTAASLICYVIVMFMIYPWIKIKLKVLIYPTWTPIMSKTPGASSGFPTMPYPLISVL
jgi:hypothetical protein